MFLLMNSQTSIVFKDWRLSQLFKNYKDEKWAKRSLDYDINILLCSDMKSYSSMAPNHSFDNLAEDMDQKQQKYQFKACIFGSIVNKNFEYWQLCEFYFVILECEWCFVSLIIPYPALLMLELDVPCQNMNSCYLFNN